jgi:peptidoglycan hydrolase-like protein with peptidoglycan-binding domain
LPQGTPPLPLVQDLRTSVPLTPSQIADVQSRLSAVGYYRGPIDGIMSAATRSAIVNYQQATRLPPSGQVDAQTANTLGVLTAPQATAIYGTPFPLSNAATLNPTTVFVQP